MPLLATRPTRLLWQGLMRCYLLTLQIPPRLSVLGLLPPIVSKTSPEGQPFLLALRSKFQVGLRGVSCVEATFAAVYLPRASHCIKFQETYVPGARFRTDAALVKGLYPTARSSRPRGGVRSVASRTLLR